MLPYFLGVLAALLIALIVIIYKESTGFRIVSYQLVNNKLGCDEIKIAVISDFHNRCLGSSNREIVDAVKSISPDAVILAGDMIVSNIEDSCSYDNALSIIRELAMEYPIYYGMGNHERKLIIRSDRFSGIYEKYVSELNKASVHLLQNEKVTIEEANIDIYGLDMEHIYFRKVVKKKISDDYLEKIFGENDLSRVSILIAHNPEHFGEYVKWAPDIVISGHVHGGIIGVPFLGGLISPQLKFFPKYDAGIFTEGNSTMILSRGLGTHTVPIRLNNKAEIISLCIRKNNN